MSLMPLAEALQNLLSDVAPLGEELVPLDQANGRILSRDLSSTRTQPPFAASAMDGYAVRHADLTGDQPRLNVIGEAAAGHAFEGRLGKGEALRIFTGAPLPENADTIVIQENVDLHGSDILVREIPKPGRYVRPAGLDFEAGKVLLKAGHKLTYRDLALAAAMNHAKLPVHRRPIVAILATGDELVRPGETPGPDQIIASNHAGVAALVEDLGGQPMDLGISLDDETIMARYVARAIDAKADILVTLGGASVGDHDLVQGVLGQAGMELAFWKIAMRPGKPLMAGHLGPMKVLGLPGNPVSSLICSLLFLKPLMEKMLGQKVEPEERMARLAADLPANDQRQEYMRASLDVSEEGQMTVRPFTRQDSSILTLLAGAGALIIRPSHAPAAKAGEMVPILLL